MDDSSRIRVTPSRSESVKFSSVVNISSQRSLSSFSSGDSQEGTPLHPFGIPFSWEKLPGKPKEFPYHRKSESSNKHLPLPPHRSNHSPNTRRKKKTTPAAMRDPFTAALVECSKGATAEREHGGDKSSKVVRKFSIGLVNLYASCRKACAVSESIVYLPRSIDRVASYDLLLSTSRRT